jgi:hypothetical protein
MSDTHSGEIDHRYGYSRLTDTWYRVDDWEVHNEEKGQIVAKSKNEVDRDDVPQHWINGVEERDPHE